MHADAFNLVFDLVCIMLVLVVPSHRFAFVRFLRNQSDLTDYHPMNAAEVCDKSKNSNEYTKSSLM